MLYKRHGNMTAKLKKKRNANDNRGKITGYGALSFILFLYTYLKVLKRFSKSRPSFVSGFSQWRDTLSQCADTMRAGRILVLNNFHLLCRFSAMGISDTFQNILRRI